MTPRQASLLPEVGRLFAQVALPVPSDGIFSYRVPRLLESVAVVGARVWVRFGTRRLLGVVVGLSPAPPAEVPPERLRDLEDCLDCRPLLSDAMLRFTRRVAERYLVAWGEVVQLALPGNGGTSVARVRSRAGIAPARACVEPLERRYFEALGAAAGGRRWQRVSDVTRRLGGTSAGMGITHRLVAAGRLEIRDEWSGLSSGRSTAMYGLTSGLEPATWRASTRRAPAQRHALEWLAASDTAVVSGRRLRDVGISAATVRALETKGLVQREDRPAAASTEFVLGAAGVGSFRLTSEQQAALEAIGVAAGKQCSTPLLLHGVTGSGKTEVYLRAARAMVKAGRSAILLVPEIGLTPQLRERAEAVFGDCVAVLHSGLASGERVSAWWRLRRGEARVAVGPRSALFAPLSDVGLIVVDEEQDGAYKQEERPRYQGRDVAILRGECDDAVVVLGSATPSLGTSWHGRQGEYRVAVLPRRVASRPMPKVDVVDMRAEWKEAGRTLLSRALEEGIERRLRRGEQALVLLNRRGYANALVCRVCGARSECPHCAVSLTLHRAERSLQCHYCDHREPVPSVCPQCGADALHDLGHGTERLQSVLAKAFPTARVGRFDADQTRKKGAHARILATFGAGDLDLLVGTQMLAKGHDFPGVTLVGVVGADAALGMPDFRAAERTFQLLTQMAGRAGRGDVPGEVLLQAHQPRHYAIEAAVDHDFERFYRHEIVYRERLRYPPFVTLAACVCRGKVATDVKAEADRLAQELRRNAVAECTVLGPASPPLSRLRGKYRMQLLLKSPRRSDLTRVLRRTLERLGADRHLPRELIVDIDPHSLM